MSGASEDADTCPACAGALAEWAVLPAGEPNDHQRYAVARCVRCDSRVTCGAPPSPELYQSGVYAPVTPRGHALISALQRRLDRRTVALLAGALAPGARVLDVGAGGGRLVRALRVAGLDASGIEPSPRSAARAAARELPVAQRTIEAHDDSELGAVVLWHVLEHLDDPAAALARVRDWLAPEGLLLVGVPNAGSLQARIAGEAWLHWDLPRHRTHFTVEGITALLRRSGFAVELVEHRVPEHNPGAMWMGILGRLGMTRNLPFHLVKRNARPRALDMPLLLLGAVVAPVALVAEWIAAARGAGGTVAVLARRA